MSGQNAYLSERGEALLEPHVATSSPSQIAIAASTWTEGVVPVQPALHWYAVRTIPRHEKRVYEHLRYREVQSLLPLYHRIHHWKNGCRARVDLPLFPGYLFVKIDNRNRFPTLGIPGILGFVGTTAGPAPLDDFEIETLRNGLDSQEFEPHPRLLVGDRVRVIAGPLAGLTGIVVRNKDLAKVVITVELIQQSVAVKLTANDLEPML